jgi:hypothetical protein
MNNLSVRKVQCPNCRTSSHLKKIIYGLPSDDLDLEKFHIGGCIPSDATHHCERYGWENESDIISETDLL